MKAPSRERQPFGLNMTAMIDVVFQLLIFFVCTVQFQKREDLLDANLPLPGQGRTATVQTEPERDLGRIEVDITATALKTSFEGQMKQFPTSAEDQALGGLMDQLKDWTRHEAGIPVRIQCQPDVPTGAMLRVYDACRRAGLTDVRLAEPVQKS